MRNTSACWAGPYLVIGQGSREVGQAQEKEEVRTRGHFLFFFDSGLTGAMDLNSQHIQRPGRNARGERCGGKREVHVHRSAIAVLLCSAPLRSSSRGARRATASHSTPTRHRRHAPAPLSSAPSCRATPRQRHRLRHRQAGRHPPSCALFPPSSLSPRLCRVRDSRRVSS